MPTTSNVGKIQELYEKNNVALYNKFSPYTDNSGLLSFGPRQPYVSVNPNDGRKGLNGLKRFESQSLPFASSLIDGQRLGKFMVSGNGILFLAKQFLLQRTQPFNETRLYNPLSPILAATSGVNPLSLFGISDKYPKRFIETGGGVLGSLASLVGISINNNPNPPPGTVGLGALSKTNQGNSKGLLRSATATSGYNNMMGKNPSGGLVDRFTNLAKSLFGGTPSQSAKYKADEGGYDLYITQLRTKFVYYDKLGAEKSFQQPYQPKSEYIKLKNDDQKIGILKQYDYIRQDVELFESQVKPNVTFENKNVSPLTKENKDLISIQLNALLSNVKNDEDYISTFKTSVDLNYKSLTDHRMSPTELDGYSKRMSSGSQLLDKEDIKRFAGAGKYDQINILTILSKPNVDSLSMISPEKQFYRPYEHDQIAFYFHDLINDKYIPFRATLKGVNEQLSANWSEISYIGRADKLYNYIGFSRQLQFNFSVVAMSIKELLPMWTRINYLASLVKPAGYTENNTNVTEEHGNAIDAVSNFIVPPMVTITIGDMYKEQPFILQTVGISIPEDASWETLPEEYAESKDWNYLNQKLKWKDSKKKYGQFPRECDINVSGPLLEQERPRVGKNNFGGIGNNARSFSKSIGGSI